MTINYRGVNAKNAPKKRTATSHADCIHRKAATNVIVGRGG